MLIGFRLLGHLTRGSFRQPHDRCHIFHGLLGIAGAVAGVVVGAVFKIAQAIIFGIIVALVFGVAAAVVLNGALQLGGTVFPGEA